MQTIFDYNKKYNFIEISVVLGGEDNRNEVSVQTVLYNISDKLLSSVEDYNNMHMYVGKGEDRKLFLVPRIDVFASIIARFFNPAILSNIFTLSFINTAINELQHSRASEWNKKLLENCTIANADDYFHLLPVPEGLPQPFKNQKIGLQQTAKFDAYALLWEMGTGKTRTAIETFIYKYKQNLVDKCLVVCPVTLIYNWQNEIETWSTFEGRPLLGTRQNKIDGLNDDMSKFFLISYDSIPSITDDLEKFVDERTMIVMDEASKIKNPSTLRSKRLRKLCCKTEYKLLLTGTPVTQGAYDLFCPYLMLDNGRTFGLYHEKFIDKYYWKYGYKLKAKIGALQKISDKIYSKASRFLKTDCIDLPRKTYRKVSVELPVENLEAYNQMKSFCLAIIEGAEKVTAPIILVQLLRLSQITSGFSKTESGVEVEFKQQPKLDALKDILESCNGSQVVIWSRFKRDVRKISEMLKDMDVTHGTLFGDDNIHSRRDNVDNFQAGKLKVLIGTQQTGGLGINLTAASVVIYYSNDYSLQNRLQSEDRVHRAGQENKVTYIDILANKTIDESIYSILRKKKDVADIVTRDNLRSLI